MNKFMRERAALLQDRERIQKLLLNTKQMLPLSQVQDLKKRLDSLSSKLRILEGKIQKGQNEEASRNTRRT
jgi:hypothetical protein